MVNTNYRVDKLKEKLNEERKKIEELRKEVKESFKKETEELEEAFRKNTVTAISSAFAFVIALAWKDVITEGVNFLVNFTGFPQEQVYGLRIVSAILVTFISVIGIVYTTKFLGKRKEEEKTEKSAASHRK